MAVLYQTPQKHTYYYTVRPPARQRNLYDDLFII